MKPESPHQDAFAPRKRLGHSMIELLVVLAIIAVLIAIMLPAVMKCFSAADRVRDANTEYQNRLALMASPEWAFQHHDQEGSQPVPEQYILVFRSSVTNPSGEAARLASVYGLKLRHVYGASGGRFKGCAVNCPAETFERIKKEGSVAYADQDKKVSICPQTIPTGIRRMNLDKSKWKVGKGFGDVNVVIAIIDTGIDEKHPDLTVVHSKGFGGLPDLGDSQDHGTHVAGSAGARDNNFGVVGTCPGARLWSLKVFDASGTTTAAVVIAALDYVRANADKVQIVNLSLGGGFNPILNDACESLVDAGIIVVVAAGNSSSDVSGFSPASAPRVITVAAMADSDGLPGRRGPATSAGADDTFSTFSNFGSLVDVIAPGVDILSTVPNNRYDLKNGTSMACPHVAGQVALSMTIKSAPIRNIRKPGLTKRPDPDFIDKQLKRTITEQIPGRGSDTRLYPMANGASY